MSLVVPSPNVNKYRLVDVWVLGQNLIGKAFINIPNKGLVHISPILKVAKCLDMIVLVKTTPILKCKCCFLNSGCMAMRSAKMSPFFQEGIEIRYGRMW